MKHRYRATFVPLVGYDNAWSACDPRAEALGVWKLVTTGAMTVEDAEELIAVSETDHAGLVEMEEETPGIAGHIVQMIDYRKAVGVEFQKLVNHDAHRHTQ